ncbi:hypothetical protein [Chamaesiphon polymorphus]|uniref:Uncharacterized protein n=1 Tax=Chamaesiphon polymorphus CCALA 037 TaxID=2107692 RepID=A0A2T1G825_9CYAN|nr:hypothetical protein [Chamaesiphon polymorphus]PSB53384.1 hypothetical protein C7B77_19595 [Chamaesiphon polymorphus CCALA 037]
MNPLQIHPIDFFSKWFAEPIKPSDYSMIGIMTAIDKHPISQEEPSQDGIVPLEYSRLDPGHFRIFVENQEVFTCFVLAEDELKADPPVYFESCLDLAEDYGFKSSEIIDGSYVLLCERFSDFLWHMLGHIISVRDISSDLFANNVNGITFDPYRERKLELDDSFICPMNREFPSSYTCYVSDRVICTPGWGAAFLNEEACTEFIDKYSPLVSDRWS